MTTLEAARAATAGGSCPRPLLERAPLYVTGKGGAGKTTVAAALGLAAAAQGRRALVCDLAGSNQLARAYGDESRLADRLTALSIDPQVALEEWLRRQPGGAATVSVLASVRALRRPPGAKELVTIGKVIDLAGTRASGLVVADGPSTGHALGMLAAPRTLGEVAPLSSIGVQARGLRPFLSEPAEAGYVGVTLPEEMAMSEVVELERELPGIVGRGLDLIVVNALYPDRFSDEEAERLGRVADRSPAVRVALAHHRRARAQAAHVRRLREHTDAPVVTLPYLFVPRIGPREYAALARELSRHVT